MNESEEMKEAGEKLLKLSEDEIAQEIAQAREDSQWAWNYTLRATEERSKEEKAIEIAKKLLKTNFTPEEITEITGLTKEEIMTS